MIKFPVLQVWRRWIKSETESVSWIFVTPRADCYTFRVQWIFWHTSTCNVRSQHSWYQEVEVTAGVIHKPLHVQGSRNKLVHVCNKGGCRGKGEEANFSTCCRYKEGDSLPSTAIWLPVRCCMLETSAKSYRCGPYHRIPVHQRKCVMNAPNHMIYQTVYLVLFSTYFTVGNEMTRTL
jgi:hypothetical protein